MIGCGTIGSGIACLLAIKGYKVDILSRSAEASGDVLLKLGRRLAELEDLKQGTVPRETDFCLTNLWEESLARADLVVEAITEDAAEKRALFQKVEPMVRKDCVLATTTMSIPLSEIFAGVLDKKRCLSTCFANPADLIRGVELATEGTHRSRCRTRRRQLAALQPRSRRHLPGLGRAHLSGKLLALGVASCRLRADRHGLPSLGHRFRVPKGTRSLPQRDGTARNG